MENAETNDETPVEPAEQATTEAPKPPLQIRKGSRIRLGFRQGRVTTVRGGGEKPYDVLVSWDGEKYQQWLIYSQVERDYELGNLQVL